MAGGRNTPSGGSRATIHPEPGRRYSLQELQDLADRGDAWAMGKVDDWEQHFADEYRGDLRDICADESCEQHGERVNICHAEDGSVLDVDHGGWGHRHAAPEARRSRSLAS